MKLVEVAKSMLIDYKIVVASDCNTEFSTLFDFFNLLAFRNTPNGADIRFIKVNEKHIEYSSVVYNDLYVLQKDFSFDFPTIEYIAVMNRRIKHYVLIHGKWRKMLDRFVFRDLRNAYIEKRIMWGEKGILIYSEDNALFIPNDELYDTFEEKFNFEYPRRIIYKSSIDEKNENTIEKVLVSGVKKT
jgi:hypothetical protein